ncbi:MAG: polysaccharide biosynthesis/export family protein [Gemmatales bacterium]|nr:polysaccharide export protein [Gemmatales bacterium]MDW7993377.1 polysaccharide biosynthesis/export family protein [Gemmatales bacterium]
MRLARGSVKQDNAFADNNDMANCIESSVRCSRHAWLVCALLLAVGCATSDYTRVHTALSRGEDIGPPFGEHPTDYRVGPGDVLALRFRQCPDWNGTYRVLPHGCIVLPKLGAFPVSGRTPDEIATLLREAYGDAVGSVLVQVHQYDSQHVYLLGEVQGGPRAVPYQGPETIVQLIQRIGGLTPDADPSAIRVHRPFGRQGEEEILHVNLVTLILEKDRRQNIYIQPYDRVVVPRHAWARLRDCLPKSWAQFLNPATKPDR